MTLAGGVLTQGRDHLLGWVRHQSASRLRPAAILYFPRVNLVCGRETVGALLRNDSDRQNAGLAICKFDSVQEHYDIGNTQVDI